MSGQKVSYVQITDREYDRFMKTSREVEKIESRVQKQLKQRENQLRKEFNNQFSSMKTRVNKQQNMIQNLSAEMQSLEKDFQNNISLLDKKINKINYKAVYQNQDLNYTIINSDIHTSLSLNSGLNISKLPTFEDLLEKNKKHNINKDITEKIVNEEIIIKKTP